MSVPTRRTPGQQLRDLRTERDRVCRELRKVKQALSGVRDAVFSQASTDEQLKQVRQVLSDNLQHTATSSRWYDLVRYYDRSGCSGTGRVAEVAEFEDGTVVMRWLSATPSTVIYDDIETVGRIHGHQGATELVPR